MIFTLYLADCIGNEKNCLYRNEKPVNNASDLAAALAFDHTCGHFSNNYRSTKNFLSSDCIVMDFDNDQTEDPSCDLQLQRGQAFNCFPDEGREY